MIWGSGWGGREMMLRYDGEEERACTVCGVYGG